ncbi:ferric reductase [Sulfitobacter alexandrii]|uniref:Ferric reductase n=1 Tax=Sulfitobacter alexandrii TaxID=1917485 RepID=A0A1J0WFC8_9RHOB|nr:ferric reductase-like transmembrane domain-containing protein [Sulfitobacter alexandrii]APE42888.1 ferric reductase [Sulfitobacter alexandrii]
MLPGLPRAAAWAAVTLAALIPVGLIWTSPYLAGRAPVYIAAGVAGATALAVLLVQPLLAGNYLPGLSAAAARRWHRRMGAVLCAAVIVHIGGLYLTSPPDTLDALMLVSPTPFSVYGVMAMWALVATVALVALRRLLPLRSTQWKVLHNLLAAVVVLGSIVHALLIEGTMETRSKWVLCIAIACVTGFAILHLRLVKSRAARR